MQTVGRLSANLGRIGASHNITRQTIVRPFTHTAARKSSMFQDTKNKAQHAMASAVDQAADALPKQAGDALKGAARAVDPQSGEAPPMHGKVAVVTGGNAGLGFETSLAMAKAGAHVILASRNPQKAEEAVRQIQQTADSVNSGAKVETIQLNLASLRSVHNFAQEFKKRNLPLNVLINNAGEFVPEDRVTEDGFELTIGTNHFGPWYLTQLLIDTLKQSPPSRIVWVTSPSETNTPDIDWDNLEDVGKQSDLSQYGKSKMYNILAMKEFQKRLGKASGIETFGAQPGIAKTEIFGKIDASLSKPVGTFLKNAGPIVGQTAEEGARALTYAATSPDMEGKGGDVHRILGPYYSDLPGLPEGMANILNIGNTAEQKATNPNDYDDAVSARLYDETARIISHKIKDFDADRKWA